MIGDVRLSAQVVNSCDTQPCVIDFITYGTDTAVPGVAEQLRHRDREAGVDDALRELGDVRRDARHLAHDDDARPGPGAVHRRASRRRA